MIHVLMQTAFWCILCHIYHFINMFLQWPDFSIWGVMGCQKDDHETTGKFRTKEGCSTQLERWSSCCNWSKRRETRAAVNTCQYEEFYVKLKSWQWMKMMRVAGPCHRHIVAVSNVHQQPPATCAIRDGKASGILWPSGKLSNWTSKIDLSNFSSLPWLK